MAANRPIICALYMRQGAFCLPSFSLAMTLSLRQSAPLIIDIDDQAPGQSSNYVGGGWKFATYYDAPGAPPSATGFYNNTFTWTNTSGDYFWFSFNSA